MSSSYPPTHPSHPGPSGLETAGWGRRTAALVVDWIASTLVTIALIGMEGYSSGSGSGWVVLVVFWLESSLGVGLARGSFGQLVTRVRVLRVDGATLPLLPAVARQLLVCLVVPPLVFKPDGRGLHDLWTDSAAYVLPRR